MVGLSDVRQVVVRVDAKVVALADLKVQTLVCRAILSDVALVERWVAGTGAVLVVASGIWKVDWKVDK